jgi:nucleoside-diphosphate-sugar epimerase
MSSQSSVLVTGASGFIGKRLSQLLVKRKMSVVCTSRSFLQIEGAVCKTVGDLSADTDWQDALQDVSTVIHCAARVHVLRDKSSSPLQAFREVNVAGTLRLAQQAADAGVRQFIFLSSVKVNGEKTPRGTPFTEESPPKPQDAYGISKYEAEQALLGLGRTTDMAITIIRPPLVYGAGVGANFLNLLRCVNRRIPLPLASIRNLRSFIFVDNLASLIMQCIGHPASFNQVFLASDGHDLSTPDLLRECASACGVKARLLPFPPFLFWLMLTLVGKKSAADRLYQSLQIDGRKAQDALLWTPPYSIRQGMRSAAMTLQSASDSHPAYDRLKP